MANIEIPVSLGLANARELIRDLHILLLNSVKIDSNSFKDIEKMLTKATGLVDKLGGKLKGAFLTSSSSQSFLREYLTMLETLATVKTKMGNVGFEDIKFSVTDLDTVDKAIEEINRLLASLTQMQKGAAIEFINQSSISGILNLRTLISSLKGDVSNLTFSELKTRLIEAAREAKLQVNSIKQDITDLDTSIATIRGPGLANVLAVVGANEKGITKKIIDPKELADANARLVMLSTTLTKITDPKLKNFVVTDKTDIAEFIRENTTKIEEEYLRLINVITGKEIEVQNALTAVEAGGHRGKNGLLYYNKAELESLMGTNEIKQALEALKIDPATIFDGIDEGNILGRISKLRSVLTSGLSNLNIEKGSLSALQTSFSTELTNVFNGIGEEIVSKTGVRDILEKIKKGLSSINVDAVKLKPFGFDISKDILAGQTLADIYAKLQTAFTSYASAQETSRNELAGTGLPAAVANWQNLTNAVATFTSVEGQSAGTLKTTESLIAALWAVVKKLADAYNSLAGSNVPVPKPELEGAKGLIESYILSLNKLLQKLQSLSNILMAVNRWMGFWQVLNMTKSAINDMKLHIQELDSVMTSISVVTNFSQEDLWGQISQYSKIARQYGVAIKGVYEVSLIYYQQGLQLNDVMTLTTETLKMARIAGLDYATAADYMTTAIRGFKLEMTDAAHVTDVFSALAATTASSTEEIAVAISKTAASAEAVGASFEATSAMMATMISTTRESATNIGTALKSVISRYGEMTSDPSKTVDSEGEEMSLNRVDKALQTVGITIHDTAGQFRDFDDVMLELMEKWDSLDSLSQRYIATLMAGNRQQSRFLALVSNVDEYKKALQTAMDSEGTGELLTLKTLDSIDAKIEKMKVTIQEFYTSSGLEELYKNILDTITNIVVAANSLPKMFDKIPGLAIAIGASIISTIKSVLTLFINSISAGLDLIKGKNTSLLLTIVEAWGRAGTESATRYNTNLQAVLESGLARHRRMENPNLKAGRGKTSKELSSTGKLISTYAGAAASIIGSLFTATSLAKYGASSSIGLDKEAGLWGILGGLSSIGGGALTGLATGGPLGAAIGAITSAVTQLPSIASAVDMISVSSTRRVELAEKAATEAKTEATKLKAETSNLAKAVDTYKELEAKAYSSAEAMQEFKDHMNTIAESYPNLISRMDESGNYIVELETLEGALAAAREKTAIATANATKAELSTLQENLKLWNEAYSASNYAYWGDDNSYKHYDEAWVEKLGSWDELWRGYGFTDEFEELGKTAKDRLLGLYNLLFPDREQLTTLGDFNNTEVRNKINEAVNEYQNLQISKMRENLKTLVEALLKVDSSLTTQYLTGFDTIDNLKDSEIILAILKLHSVALDHIDFYTNSINNVAKILVSLTTGTYLTLMQNLADITDLFDYDQHSSLIKSLVSGKQSLQWLSQSTTDEGKRKYEKSVKDITTKYVDFFKLHEEMATWLENLDLGLIKSLSELKTLLKEHITDDESKIDEEIRLYFLNLYEENSTLIKDNFLSALQSSFTLKENGQEKQLISSDIYNKFANLVDQSADEFGLVSVLNASLSNYISSLMPTFSSMVNNTPIMAEIILDNIANLFTSIGALDSSMLAQISSIITNIDFFDSDSILTAINSLEGLGPDFNNIVTWLGALQKNLVINVKTQSISLLSELTLYGKSIELALSNYDKEFSYSEILEQAFSLIDNDSSLTLDDLITLTKNGKFIFTDIGIDALLKQAKEKENTKIQELRAATENKLRYIQELIEAPEEEISNIISSEERYDEDGLLISEDIIEFNYDKAKLFLGKKYLGKELNSRLIELEQLYTNWSNLEESVRGSFSDYLLTQSSDLTNIINSTITIGEQLDSIIANSYLKSFDYKSLVSGGSTNLAKTNLKTLLSSVISSEKKDSFSAKFDEEIYPLLILGKIDEYNSQLESFGLSQYKVSETDINRVRFESLKSLYNTLIDDNPVWAALDDTQRILLESIGINEEKYNTEGVSSAITAVWAALSGLADGVIANLDELRSEIAKNADNNFKQSNAGKLKDLLEKYKDSFTADELVELLGNQELLLNKEGKLTEQASLYLKLDKNTGNYILLAGLDAASVIKALANILNISIDTTTDEYKNTIKESVDKAIADADKADIGKLRVNAWQTVMSGKAGDRISLAGVDDTTKGYMKAAGLIDDISSQFVYIESEKSLNEAIKWMRDWLSNDNHKQHNPLTARYFLSMVSEWEAKTAKNVAFEGIIGDTFNQSAAEALSLALLNTNDYESVLLLMQDMQFLWDAAGLVWKANSQSINAARAKISQSYSMGQIDLEEFYKLTAGLNDTENAIDVGMKLNNAIADILLNSTNVSETIMATFMTQFGERIKLLGYKLESIFKSNDDGTYDVDAGELKKFLDSIGFAYSEAVNNKFANITDSYLEGILTANNYVTSGTSSFSDMQKFTDEFNSLGIGPLQMDFSDIFVYDKELNNFKLSAKTYEAYLEAQKDQLRLLGLTEDVINEYINDRTTVIQLENLDISSFINSTDILIKNKALKKMIQTLEDMGFSSSSDLSKIDNTINLLKDMSIETIISILSQGGLAAVDLLIALKGESVTSEEIGEVYNALISLLKTALSELRKGVGETVTGLAAELIRATGQIDSYKEVGNGDIVITSAKALVKALLELYLRLKASNEATTAEINDTFADLIDALFNRNNDIKDLLEQGGAGIDIRTFGQVLSEYGRQAEDFFTLGLINIDLFGKVFIPNFKAFATEMGWGFNSKEYQEYYNTYVESIIELLNKPIQAMEDATNLITSILDAKIGLAINVTEIERIFTDKYGFNLLKSIANKYSAELSLGILKISETTDVLGLVEAIASEAEKAGLIIPELLAEITDSILAMLSNISSLLASGLEGKLSNVDANSLNSWYRNRQKINGVSEENIKDLNFTLTQEGLRIANSSARELYLIIKDINTVEGQISFNNLKNSLIETEDHFKTVLNTTAYILELRKEIGQIENTPNNSARLKALEDELELAEKINMTRSIDTEDDSFKFMEGSIPKALNNPLNYWNNWAKAFEAMRTAGKAKGKALNTIGYKDFYNIVTEIGRLADLSGTAVKLGNKTVDNSKAAADLITLAAGALKNVNGEMKIDLSKLNIDFSSGLKDLGKNIDALVDALADSQMNMLDAVIAVLEIIVAMEDLKNLDVDGDLTLDLTELGIEVDSNDPQKITKVDATLKATVDKLLNLKQTVDGETSILKALSISTGKAEVNLQEFLENYDNVEWLSEKGFTADAYKTLFSNLYKLATDPTWAEGEGTIEDFFSKWANLNWGDLVVTARTGNYTLKLTDEGNIKIDWEHANYKNLLNVFNEYKDKKDEEIRKEIESLIAKSEKDSDNIEVLKKLNLRIKILQEEVIPIIDPDNPDKEPQHFKVAGKTETYNSIEEATAAAIVYETGATNVTVNTGTNTITATGTLKIGAIEMSVTSTDNSNAELSYEYNGKPYKGASPEEVIDNIIKNNPNDFVGFSEDKEIDRKSVAYKLASIQLGVSLTPIITYEIDGQLTEGNLLTDANLRDAVEKFIQNKNNWTAEDISIDGEAVNVKLAEGINYTVPKDKVTITNGDVVPESLYNYFLSALGIDLALKDTITQAMTAALAELPNLIANIKSDGIESLAAAMLKLADAVQLLLNAQWGTISEGINSLNKPLQLQLQNLNSDNLSTTETTNITTIVTKFEPDTTAVENAKKEISDEPVTMKIDGDERDAIDAGERAKATIDAMRASINISTTGNATGAINSIRNALTNLANGGRPYVANILARVIPTKPGKAAGTLGLANSKGTLMGELGPELVVSKGRYFVVGLNGPEMVDLDDDAIVFNHLQTQSLLTKGMSNGRGRAVTNERNAVSFATGNVDGGPAMASASAALAALKELRAMWESLKSASVSDLAGAGGGGGGGGGGNKIVDPKAWVKTVERWYNLTQEIAKLEKDITHEETLRSKLLSDFNKNGTHYYNSQRLSLKALRELVAAQELLNLSRQDYYKKRIDALKNEPLGKLYTFDEQGQMHFRDDVTMNGLKGAMNFLTDLMGFDENGKANYTNELKYNILKQYGFDEYMKYNSNGEQILLDADHSGDVTDEERETYYQQATEAWRDRMDNFASETLSLWDSILEGENSLLELLADQNEILLEMRDNLMAVEEDVLKAIEDMRQREIDALLDERDKLEDSTGKYIEGLSDALSKEQEMYDNQLQENDLNLLRRRLAILLRSGGSAADIANLQNEINSNERSRYFDLQQLQIDAIQQASDLLLERMDNLIELMTETLEYQKEYGLLWSEVYDVMSHSAALITSFIMNGNSEFWAKSPLGTATSTNDTLFKADQWVGFREDMTDITTDVANLAFAANELKKANDYKIYDSAMKKEFGSNYDSKGKYKGIFELVYDETGDITKASAAARAEYLKDKKAEEDKKKAEEAKKPKTTSTSTSTSTPTTNNSSNNNNLLKQEQYKVNYTVHGFGPHNKQETRTGSGIGPTPERARAIAEGYASKQMVGLENPKVKYSAAIKYSKGGYANFTGLALLDGTKEKPEAVFNAAQTKILRDNILSNKPNSLITLLNTYNEAYKDGISVAPLEASGQLIIENATVNMNVEQIANDYDARRAGELALNEMMRIARKTGAANSIRR